VPVFTGIEDVTGWLVGQPRDIGVIFATRAALRVIPVLASTFDVRGTALKEGQRATVLRVFRCVAAAWAVASFPGRAPDLRPAANAACRDINRQTGSDPENAAVYAAAAAGGGFEGPDLTLSSIHYSVKIAAGCRSRVVQTYVEGICERCRNTGPKN